jgi:hypothetical protein
MIVLLGWVCVPAQADGSQMANLTAGFSPDALGASTTIEVGFKITTLTGAVPSPLTDVDLSLPPGVGLGRATLGDAICMPQALQERGQEGCPPNSLMGFGRAMVEVPIGPEVVSDTAEISIYMAPPQGAHTTMVLYADAHSPVIAQIEFQAQLLPEGPPYGAQLDTTIPLTPTLPEAPDAAVVNMHSGLGPKGIIYHERSHGGLQSYKPIGLAVPATCPRRGFPFAATFTFEDGTTASSRTVVPCPTHRRQHRKPR